MIAECICSLGLTTSLDVHFLLMILKVRTNTQPHTRTDTQTHKHTHTNTCTDAQTHEHTHIHKVYSNLNSDQTLTFNNLDHQQYPPIWSHQHCPPFPLITRRNFPKEHNKLSIPQGTIGTRKQEQYIMSSLELGEQPVSNHNQFRKLAPRKLMNNKVHKPNKAGYEIRSRNEKI